MRELIDVVSATLAETSATARPVSLVSIELDRLQALRSALGPSGADDVCEQIARMLQRILRTGDYVQRVSDGELVVMLLGAGVTDARQVAHRIGAAVRGHEFSPGQSMRAVPAAPRVTISAGVAAAPDHGADPERLVSAARQACAGIAQRGGDGVAVAHDAADSAALAVPDVGRFAGRLTERRTLFRLLDEAAAGHPRIVSIVGEPGSGTLTLARQLEPEVRLLGGSTVYGRGRMMSVRQPYGPWAGVLQTVRRVAPPPDQVWRELPKLVPTLPRDPAIPAGTKYRLMEEIAAYLRIATAKWPLVVVLDEMQWADEASWDTLDHLVEHLTDERLLVCITMRTGVEHTPAAERLAALQHHAGYQELHLSRLTREEVKRWLEAALDHQEVGRDLLAFVYRHTEGNPFLLTQLVRCLTEEGSLWNDGQQWQWKAVSGLRMPSDAEGILSRRLERFSASTHAVLSTAAVIGREFDVPLVEAAGAGSARAVEVAVEEGLASGVLQYTYERRRKAFLFTHESIADVLARSPSPEQARLRHERVARAMEARGDGTIAEIAQHYDAAGVAVDAYRTALDAATQAEALYALTTAGDFLQLAARNAPSPGDLAEGRVRLAQIAEALGRYDEEEELCDLALDWFAGEGDERRALTLRRMRERARKELGQPARRSLDALRVLDDAATQLGFDEERVAILTLLSQVHGRLGEPREAARIAAECVEMAERIGDPLLLAEALTRFGITVETESPKRARECYERALGLARAGGDIRAQVRCYNNLGIVLQLESQIDAARESLATAITLARAAGMADLWAAAALNLGLIIQKLGDYDRARELFSEALGLSASLKNTEYQLYALFNMAHAARESGQPASGAELYDATASLAQRIGQSDVEIGARAGEGLCLLAMNRGEEARRPLAEAESRMATRAEWFQGRELVETLRVLVAAAEGRRTDALEQFEQARALADATDLYSAAWFTAACADAIFRIDRGVARAAVERYASRVAGLGFTSLTDRYAILAAIS